MAGFTIGGAKSAAHEGIAGEAETAKILDSREKSTSLVVSEPELKTGRTRLVDDDFPFDESQLAAVEGMVASQYACLTGAAGTGKTTTTKKFVDRLLDTAALTDVNLANYWSQDVTPADEDDDYVLDETHSVVPSVAMCAYTGRASQQIKKNFPVDWHNNIMTIHRLLGFVPEYYEEWDSESGKYKTKMRFVPTYNENCLLPWDVILIDEAGMQGLDLWHQLYAAMKPGCRVFMVGDINQLPPIYGKSIFGFAMARWPTFELAKVHRQAGAENPIVDNAWRVIHGIRPETEGRFKMMEIPVDSLKASSIVRGVSRKLHQLGVYKPLRDAVITPIHGINPGTGSALGDYPLNEHYSHMFNDESGHPRYVIDGGREKKLFAVGDKVMATKNDWASGITNGMTGHISDIIENPGYSGARQHYGLLKEVNARFAGGGGAAMPLDMESLDLDNLDEMAAEIAADKAAPKEKESRDRGPSSHTVIVRFGDGDTAFDKPFESLAEVGTLQLAYVVTCHKMQGGEAPTIIIILHESHSRSLSREWLYTAITRASENCIVLYTDRGLRIALNRQAIPGSTLRDKILSFQAILDPTGDGSGVSGIKLPVDPNNTLPTILQQDSVRDLADRETERRLTATSGPPTGLAALIAKQRAKAEAEASQNDSMAEVIRTETVHTIKVRVVEERVVTPPPPPPPPPIVDGGDLHKLPDPPAYAPLTQDQRATRDAALVRNVRFAYPEQLANFTDSEIVEAYDEWYLCQDSLDRQEEEDFLDFLPERLRLTYHPRPVSLVSQPFQGCNPERLEHEAWVAGLSVPPATPKVIGRPAIALGSLFAGRKVS